MTVEYNLHISSNMFDKLYREYCEYYDTHKKGIDFSFNNWIAFVKFLHVAEKVRINESKGIFEITFRDEESLTFFLLTL